MTKQEQADQLRLAAGIIETGHPWESLPSPDAEWARHKLDPIAALSWGHQIRPILATPPDGRPLHNPDNLTAEQVGVGYRLLIKEEFQQDLNLYHYEWWSICRGQWVLEAERRTTRSPHCNSGTTYRLPLSVPWPEVEKSDLYAELKAAHAAGKVIQWQSGDTWVNFTTKPVWSAWSVKELRIKPWTLPPPPPGIEWHRTDGWTKDDLPQGYRPHILGEVDHEGDDVRKSAGWTRCACLTSLGSRIIDCRRRTTRPLTFTHLGKTWTWHKPGDPMPCFEDTLIETLFTDGSGGEGGAHLWEWSHGQNNPIGWRYAKPATKTVDLGPKDVPPGSFIRSKTTPQAWESIGYLGALGVFDYERKFLSWHKLAESYEINRSIPLTGRWNPTAWEPCSKQIPA